MSTKPVTAITRLYAKGGTFPWLQDTQEDDWWGTWGITYRDVVILNRDGNEEAVFNLTEHDLGNPNEYAAFKALLLDVAGQESITTTTTTIPLSSTTSTESFRLQPLQHLLASQN